MKEEIFQIDSFTHKPFTGNPAAVCLLESSRNENWMQQLAKEMNLSETAFLFRRAEGFELRWFTPTCEVDLCGHATLAGAFALWEAGVLKPVQEARFYTKSGLLTARKKADHIELDFPAEPVKPSDAPEGLAEALGIQWKYIARNRFDYLLEVDSEEIVRSAKPDFATLKEIVQQGVIITSVCSSADYDFISRYFAPAEGINEDPVTGSAHCALGPYWGKKLSTNILTAFQASERGGVVGVRLDENRVHLIGRAVLVFRGKLSKAVCYSATNAAS